MILITKYLNSFTSSLNTRPLILYRWELSLSLSTLDDKPFYDFVRSTHHGDGIILVSNYPIFWGLRQSLLQYDISFTLTTYPNPRFCWFRFMGILWRLVSTLWSSPYCSYVATRVSGQFYEPKETVSKVLILWLHLVATAPIPCGN